MTSGVSISELRIVVSIWKRRVGKKLHRRSLLNMSRHRLSLVGRRHGLVGRRHGLVGRRHAFPTHGLALHNRRPIQR